MKKKLTIVPLYDWMADVPEIIPQPAKNYVPDWYKKTPIDNSDNLGFKHKLIPTSRTVRTCPSFMDVFKDGYVLPSPCDIWFKIGDNGDAWEWQTSTDVFRTKNYQLIDEHHDGQFIEHLPNKEIKKVFKIHYPWFFIAPKGYSIRQMPMMYHYDKDWFVPYGIIKNDMYAEINPQICITSYNKEILIKKGSPLCYIIPFKRNDAINLEIGTMDRYKNDIEKKRYVPSSTFRSSYHTYED